MIKLPNSVPAKFVSELADGVCKTLSSAGIPFMKSGKFVNYLSKVFGYKDYNTLAAKHIHVEPDHLSDSSGSSRNEMRAYLIDSIREIFQNLPAQLSKMNKDGTLADKIKGNSCTDLYQVIMFALGEDERLEYSTRVFSLHAFSEEQHRYAIDEGIRFSGDLKTLHNDIAKSCYREEFKDELADFCQEFEEMLPDHINPVNIQHLPWDSEAEMEFSKNVDQFIDEYL